MEKSLNVVEKISDQLYVITETESVHCYLVIGSDKAMLFDIGYGYENIHATGSYNYRFAGYAGVKPR